MTGVYGAGKFPLPLRNGKKPGMDSTSGVSEIIGSILLISIVVLAVSIVGVILFSQTMPGKIPNVNFMVGTDDKVPPTLYLYHNGGDALTSGEFSVLVDGVPKPYTIAGGGNEWSLGKNLAIPLATGITAHNIVLVYNNSGSGAVVLRSASANVSSIPQNINPDRFVPINPPVVCINGSNPQEVVSFMLNNVSLIGDAINQSPSTVGPVIAHVAGANSINFYREKGTTINQYSYYTFKVTLAGSTILTDASAPNPIPLNIGDVITITQADNNNGQFKIFGLGDQLWEVSAEKVTLKIKMINGSVYTEPVGGGTTTVRHSWITRYSDMGSTLTLTSSPQGRPPATGLIINGSEKINGDDSRTVTITNIRPVGIGLFILESDPTNANAVYFVGNAQSVTY